MKRKDLLSLFFVGLTFNLILAWFQLAPGYMDADYYYSGGLRLVQGHGFIENYRWNYLATLQSLPYPSLGYWFPFASILAAIGMLVTGQQAFWAARLGFILVAALVPHVTALLCFQIKPSRAIAISAGLLAVFSGYHAPFMPTTDNFGLFMLFGGLFFIIFPRKERFSSLLLGLIVGFMNLSRVDGLLWLVVGIVGFYSLWRNSLPRSKISVLLYTLLFFIFGYTLVMGPWILRNLSTWGTPLTPAGSNVIWMTDYDDTFAWPASRINWQTWLATGWLSALNGRLNAIQLNFINTIAAQCAFLLFPFILTGVWVLRKDLRIRLAVLNWVVLFFMMSIIFPFAGARGSFFHAAAALQPIWFTAAVIGMDSLVEKVRARGWFTPSAPAIFRTSLVLLMALLTIYLANVAIIENDWNHFFRTYTKAETMLVQNGALIEDAVIVANSPAYYSTSGRSAIIVPDENLNSVHALAHQFGARFLILEKAYDTDPMSQVYKNPQGEPGLIFLGEFENVRVFKIIN